ncbi:MAG: tRNA (adenosine(37)-N6)-threonylcarbamoyltransferase complex ATPase subunit type 1 TsaE [Rhodospirillaceae bacterium]
MTGLPLLKDMALQRERDTLALGAALATLARPGDILALNGPLGAGKTTLARGFITSRTHVDEDVVSPTFTLVQVYDAEAAPIWHFDLYRLTRAADVLELGWEEAMSGGIILVEWSERLGPLLPPQRLEVVLAPHRGGEARSAKIYGGRHWKDRIAELRDG